MSVDLSSILRFIDGGFGLFAGERFTRDAVLAFDPSSEIHELAPLSTEGTKLVVFPVDWFTAGWTLHRSGRSIHRSGREIHRSGRSIHRSGRAIHRSGRAIYSTRRAIDRVCLVIHSVGYAIHNPPRAIVDVC